MKRKRFVIYKRFRNANKTKEWMGFDSEDEAHKALARLQSSPSAERNYYYLHDRDTEVTHERT